MKETRPPFRYTFQLDGWEEVVMTHDEYLEDERLRGLVEDPTANLLILGRKLIVFSDEFMANDEDALKYYEACQLEQLQNPIKFYAPATYRDLDFINDWDGNAFLRIDSNRVGKTTGAFIKLMLGAMPMDPEWPIFTEYGIEYKEFRHPLKLAVASYEWKQHESVLFPEMVKKWVCNQQLGVYGRDYRGKGAKDMPAFKAGQTRYKLRCGTVIDHLIYSGSQASFEGSVYHRILWDEQGRRKLFIGANERLRSVNGIHLFSLTPHKIDERPDTGAGSFIDKLVDGSDTMGLTVKAYCKGTEDDHGGIEDMPSWYYPQAQKESAYEQHLHIPLANGDDKALAEGKARLFGIWHTTGGLILDEWRADMSRIEPLPEWKDGRPPKWMTLYRGLDHGMRNPFSCLYFAVDRQQRIYLYRVIYQTGRTIQQNVREVIAAAGNKVQEWGRPMEDVHSGTSIRCFEELFKTEAFQATVIDSRSAGTKDPNTGYSFLQLYRFAGLTSARKASGKFLSHWRPLAQQMLRPSPDFTHPVTGESPAPQLYVFNTCIPFLREITSWKWKAHTSDDANPKEVPEDKNNHAMTAFGYALQIPMRFLGSPSDIPDWRTEDDRKKKRPSIGYRRI